MNNFSTNGMVALLRCYCSVWHHNAVSIASVTSQWAPTGVPLATKKQLCWCHQVLIIHIRKSKDYVYGIWVYKALGIWKGYYRVKKSLVSYMKPWTEARNNEYMKYHSKLTYQLSFWNVSRKVDYHAGGKWFIHGPKRRKENQLLSLKHPCWLSLL